MAVKATIKPTVTVPKIKAGTTPPGGYGSGGLLDPNTAVTTVGPRLSGGAIFGSYQYKAPTVTAPTAGMSPANKTALAGTPGSNTSVDTRPYEVYTPAQYSAVKASVAPASDKVPASLGGPTMSYTGGAYPGYAPPQVKYPTAPTPGYFSSQAPDPRVTNVMKPYDTPTQAEWDTAKALADNAMAKPTGTGGGDSSGYGWGGGGGWSSQMNWTSQLINWRI
jgi:hypothetical protein